MLVRHALMGTLTVSLASGFTQPNPQTIRRPATTTSSSSRVFSTIERPKSIPPPPLNNVDGIGQSNNNNQPPIAYDCNDEAECVEVPICDDVQCRTSLDVRIHSTWYDLSGVRPILPGHIGLIGMMVVMPRMLWMPSTPREDGKCTNVYPRVQNKLPWC
jgi:hypothetical protein